MPRSKAYISNKKVIIAGGMIDLWTAPEAIYAIGLDRKPRSAIGQGINVNLTPEEIAHKNKINAQDSYRRFEHLVSANFSPKQSVFVTLTFEDTDEFDITDVSQCNKRFTRFIDDKMRKKYGKDFKYVTTIEFQDKNNRGAVHYHMMISLPYIKNSDLQKLWGYGFTKVKKIEDTKHSAVYVGKYMRKGLIDERLIGKNKYWSSRNLYIPPDRYGTNADKVLAFLATLPDGQKEKYSESSYLSEYHRCNITHSRIFVNDEIANQLLDYLNYNTKTS